MLWVVGDSWTDPSGLARIGWPTLVAARLGMGLVNSGVGGAGYINGVSYPTQVARGSGAGADVVVFWGSLNDYNQAPGVVAAAAADAYRMALALCPDAGLLVTGPQFWHEPPWPQLYGIRDAVRDVALDVGASFIDPLEWMQGRQDLMAFDGAHPGAEGHEVLADLLTREVATVAPLATLGARPLPAGGGYAYERLYPRVYADA